jgi:hypothetical protein
MERGRYVVTAAAGPQLFSVGADTATRARFGAWPVGPALLERLGEINSDVHTALADERAWLSENGYPEDLPLPALWWNAPTES